MSDSPRARRLEKAITSEHAKSPGSRRRALPKPRFSLGQGQTQAIGQRGRRTGAEIPRGGLLARGADGLEDFSEYFRSDDEEESEEEGEEELASASAAAAAARTPSRRSSLGVKSSNSGSSIKRTTATPKSALTKTPRTIASRLAEEELSHSTEKRRVSPRRASTGGKQAAESSTSSDDDHHNAGDVGMNDFDFGDDGFEESLPSPSPRRGGSSRRSSPASAIKVKASTPATVAKTKATTPKASGKKAVAPKSSGRKAASAASVASAARPTSRKPPASTKRKREVDDLLNLAGSSQRPSISPAAARGERASKRQRHRPLQFWLNERIEYAPHTDGVYPDAARGYHPAELNAPPPRENSGRARVRDKPIPNFDVVNRKTKERKSMALAKSKGQVVPRQVPKFTVTSVAFEEPDFSSGVVLIPKNTTEKSRTDKTEVFFVDFGSVHLTIGGSSKKDQSAQTVELRRGAHFYLPAHTRYTISNKTGKEAVLVFFTPS